MSGASRYWLPPERPGWLAAIIDESRHMDPAAIVPLDAENLIETARRRTGLSEFGENDWREPFEILTRSLDDDADLHLFGRIMTRNELLNLLEARLRVEHAYRLHPEIDDEVIDAPVIITGLGRSGTSILFELLSQDSQFGVPSSWEAMFPCPPPETETYRSDPRAEAAHHLLTQWGRAAPPWQAMHESGGWIPAECVAVYEASFRSDNMPSKAPMASYSMWLASADMTPALEYYRRVLKLLQWRNPRRHWLLKSPSHLGYLPTLFNVFPDARLVVTHRDPIKANASITNMLATLYWMRSNQPFDVMAFEALMTPEATAARLNQLIDWVESGAVPASQIFASRYADLINDPEGAISGLYERMGITLDAGAAAAMESYLEGKPKGKFGAHKYGVGEDAEVRHQRDLYSRYQQRFDVPDED
ncbi:putative sulfotransferase [Sphingomonas sp. DBB INV C78]|uniref:sulfotransferase family protein n=1 Tax=Sphingomonas sp. DBB INV C78 TaxID=3349434 RepID=UPI0036D36199